MRIIGRLVVGAALRKDIRIRMDDQGRKSPYSGGPVHDRSTMDRVVAQACLSRV